MSIKIEYSVDRIYQHQLGQTWAVVKITFIDHPDKKYVEASFPLTNLEGRIQAYVRELESMKLMQNVRAEVEI